MKPTKLTHFQFQVLFKVYDSCEPLRRIKGKFPLYYVTRELKQKDPAHETAIQHAKKRNKIEW